MKPKFEVGEWCFCEFKLQQIKSTKEDRITGVTDSMFELGGNDLTDRCFPLDLKIKRISDTVAYWSDSFHKLNAPGLNYPDLNRYLISAWVDMCEAKDDDTKLKELNEALGEFGRKVLQRIDDLRYETIEGLKLFRQ